MVQVQHVCGNVHKGGLVNNNSSPHIDIKLCEALEQELSFVSSCSYAYFTDSSR